MKEETPAKIELVKIEPIVQLVQTFIPEADLKTGKAVEAMKKIIVIEDDEDKEYASDLLVRVKSSYDKFSGLRKSITEPLDQLKAELMQYEKRVAYDGKTDNEYTRIRKLIASYEQQKLDEIKKKEDEAKRLREIEDYKVDLGSQMRQNLVNMVMSKVVETNDWSEKHFKSATLENWEEKVKLYMGIKPGLREEFYNNCLIANYDKNKLSAEEYDKMIEEFKKSEPLDKWREMVIDGITPVLNDWRAKIPQIKAEKIELANANEKDKERIAKEQAERAEAEELRKKEEFAKLQKETNKQIEQEAELSKMSNSFVEQAQIQQMGDKGPVKKVLKFTDNKVAVKALSTIIYHCLAHKEFPGIQKKDGKKELVFDDKGRPEYIESVQKWIDFFLANCDAHIEGTKVYEDVKVIVRK